MTLSKITNWLAPERTVAQSLLLFVVRLYWGWQFFQTGKGKLAHLANVGEYFQSLGIPLPHAAATFTGLMECAGGILLLLGLVSRLTAIPLTLILVVAYCTASAEAVKNIFSNPEQFFAADPFLFLYAVILILAFGPGKFSIDWILRNKMAPGSDGNNGGGK